jgi:hypothetical protein
MDKLETEIEKKSLQNAFARKIVDEYAYSESGFENFIIRFNEILKQA